MRGAILDAAQFGKTSGMAAEIVRCRMMNEALGTDLRPWELGDVPEEWLTAVEMWAVELPKARAWWAESQAAVARVRGQRKQ
jgi:anti-sigma factor RsiW